jgi:diaminohydroxyphosphoribosylaminopyrimidine deaminase/5-amino-6-(5-phosphoribosylamino)uracil reductase
VVLDTELRCNPGAQVFRDGGAVTFAAVDAAAAGAPSPHGDLTVGGVQVERVARTPGGLDLDAVVARLAALEINEVLLECGARLAGAFVARGLVDELVLYVAPSLLGENAAPLLHLGPGAPHASNASGPAGNFEFSDVRRIGDDVRLLLTLRKH